MIPKNEIEKEFAISFDDYFAPKIARLVPLAADGLVEYRILKKSG